MSARVCGWGRHGRSVDGHGAMVARCFNGLVPVYGPRISEAKVNLREGTRRLALLLGIIGAISGGFGSYSELQTIREQRARHNRFEQLAASYVAQHALRSLKLACSQNPSDKQCGDEQYVPMSEVNGGGIKTIYWSKDYQVDLIQTDDGDNLFPTPEPSMWHDPFIVLLPILGFFIPSGAVRAIGWVGAGFVAGAK